MNRLIGVGLAAVVVVGCGDRALQRTGLGGNGVIVGGAGGSSGTAGRPWGLPANRNVDILFMIDNSSGMSLAQANLTRNFPAFLGTLQNRPAGLPNLHLAVITSDLGAGDGSISGCDSAGGRAGIFQYTARGACTATNLQPGATYIIDVDGVRNYTGNLEDVFTCIAAVGTTGCGYEQPLASVSRALGADGRPPPAENQGFVRADALLFIILVTDEDDCSTPAGSDLYDTAVNTTIGSPLGPVTSFRCNEFGHLCNGVKPPRVAPTGSTSDRVTLDGCTSAEGAGRLTPVATFVDQVRALKADPSMVLVAAITGPSAPYVVGWKAPSISDPGGPWPQIAHSCTAPDGSFADPAVRLAQWASLFGADGLVLSICSDSFAPSLQRLAERLAERMSPPPLGGLQ